MSLTPASSLDSFDVALLDALQLDNGRPLRELAVLVHLSTASVQRRLQRLRKDGYILADTAVVDPDRVGQVITLIVEVYAERTQSVDLEDMKQSFSGPEIQQCYYVTGEADFLLVLTVALERVKTTLHVPLDALRKS